MNLLNYSVLEQSGYKGFFLKDAPEKVLQFGEGNFLRGFVDYWFDLANEKAEWNGKCVLVQPIASGLSEKINAQEGLYTLYLRGNEKGKKVDDMRVISSVSRCLNPYDDVDYDKIMEVAVSDDLEYIVSNTTEAGIVYDPSCNAEDRPPASFPAKLTQVLYRRWKAGKKGVIILACELIDNNGAELLDCIDRYIDQWSLEGAFRAYVHEDCSVCGSLVDRIVPGSIRDEREISLLEEKNGYKDALIDVGECFGLWVIEGDEKLNDVLPFSKAGLRDKVFVVPDMKPYKNRKVRILNGAHTGFVLGAFLSGQNIVRNCMQDDVIRGFMNKMIYEEIIPTLSLDKDELKEFAAAVQDRFNNPFIDHELLSISLNTTSKWRARNLPSLIGYVREKQEIPVCLAMSLAAYIAFYSNDVQRLDEDGLVCRRPEGDEYKVQDDRWVLEFFHARANDTPEALTRAVLENDRMWGANLTDIAGLEDAVAAGLRKIREEGAYAAFKGCL